MIKSLRGTREQALQLQQDNAVPKDQCGPWFHGTRRPLLEFTNKQNRVTWFTRSRGGGIPWGSYAVEAYVVQPLDDPHFDDCQAGDDEGKYPEDPSRGLPKWWLKVNTAEISKIMVVEAVDIAQIKTDPTRPGMNDEDYIRLREALEKINR